MRLLELVLTLFVVLPWWGALAVLGGLVLSLFVAGWWIFYRLQRDLTNAALSMGQPLKDAVVQIHSVNAAPMPKGPSALDGDEDDENYDPEFDGDWDDEGCRFFWIDATISPESPDTIWDPTALTVVNANWSPTEDLEICLETGIPHTIEAWRNGSFEPFTSGSLTGPQRLRMLFAVPELSKHLKIQYHFTCFGRLTLPEGVPAAC